MVLKAFILLFMLCLAGCSEGIILNSNLTEQEANDIIAELNRYQIDGEKKIEKTGITVKVSKAEFEKSIHILNAAGLPKKEKSNLGVIFQKSGVISSPLEERARYIYALSQEVESTLEKIDGVIIARVHIVLPERIAPGEPVQPASTSVFIKHQENLMPDAISSRIVKLVSTSIPGLIGRSAEDLNVVFFSGEAYKDKSVYTNNTSARETITTSQAGFYILIASGLVLFVYLFIVFFKKNRYRSRVSS